LKNKQVGIYWFRLDGKVAYVYKQLSDNRS